MLIRENQITSYSQSWLASHIDYVFLPRMWLNRVSDFSVGTFEAWCGSGLSDHVPVMIDIAPDARAAGSPPQRAVAPPPAPATVYKPRPTRTLAARLRGERARP